MQHLQVVSKSGCSPPCQRPSVRVSVESTIDVERNGNQETDLALNFYVPRPVKVRINGSRVHKG